MYLTSQRFLFKVGLVCVSIALTLASDLSLDEKSSLWNSVSTQSLSLNLKNHYSLGTELPITSTPAGELVNTPAPLDQMDGAESYLNLLNLEKGESNGKKEVDWSAEGSEVTANENAFLKIDSWTHKSGNDK